MKQNTAPTATALEDILLGRNWVSRADLHRAMETQKALGGSLATCLLEVGALSEERLARALSESFGVPWAEIDALRDVPEEVLRLLPRRLAVRCKAVPFHLAGNALHVAMLDPRQLACQDEIAFACGKRVHVHVASEVRIIEALDRFFGHEAPSRLAALLDQLNRSRYLWKKGSTPVADHRESQDSEPGLQLPEIPDPVGELFPERPLPPPPSPAPPAAPTSQSSAQSSAQSTAPSTAQRRPAPPPPPSSIKLSPEELRRLYPEASRRRPTEAAGDPFATAATALAEARDREGVAGALLDLLSSFFDHFALFVVRRDRVEGWRGGGEGVDLEVLARLEIPLGIPSAFLNLMAGSPFHLGPLAAVPAHRELVSCWGGEFPVASLLLPIRLHDRVVAVLYGDRGGHPPGDVPLGRFQTLAEQAALAFERCIVLKKQRASGLDAS